MSELIRSTKPFLKWAGGKRWLVAQHGGVFPRSFRTYREPFLGGGSVFFHLIPQKAVLGDTNASLISCYKAIRDNWRRVWLHLLAFQRQHSDEFYYAVRSTQFKSPEKEAARFIYLN